MNLKIDDSLQDYFYGGFSKENEKKIVDKYINIISNSEMYENSINKLSNVEELYHLSSIGQNIISWYPFSNNANVLVIGGGLGNIVEYLCAKGLNVTCVEPVKFRATAIAKRCSKYEKLNVICSLLNKSNISIKFDYIILINNLEYWNEIMGENITLNAFLKYVINLLKSDGRLLMTFNNSNSLKRVFNFTTNHFLTSQNTFSKEFIINTLDGLGLKSRHIYYPLPNAILPNVIFSDYMLPDSSSIEKFVSYYDNGSIETFNEIDAFRTIINIDPNIFANFSNSFLIDAGKEKSIQKYFFISFNNIRKEKYRLITKISNEYVEKEPINNISKQHFLDYTRNISIIKNENKNILDEFKNEKIISKYIDQKYMVKGILLDLLKESNITEFYKLFDEFIDYIKTPKKNLSDIKEKDIFGKYNINIEQSVREELHMVNNGFWDMTMNNCFYINDKFYFFDQEWREDNIPLEYIIFKNIYYNNSFDEYVSKMDLYKHFKIEEYIEIFIKLDEKIQDEIKDKKNWDFYTKDFHQNVCTLVNEFKNQSNEFDNYKKITEDLIKEKDNEIKNCNIRLENSRKRIEEQERIINKSFMIKTYKYVKNILKGDSKNEEKN